MYPEWLTRVAHGQPDPTGQREQSRGRCLTVASSPAARPAPTGSPRAPASTYTGCTACGEP